LGFGDYTTFSGHAFQKGGNVIYWRARYFLKGFGNMSNLTVGDHYWIGKCGQDSVSSGLVGKLMVGYQVTSVSPLQVKFGLYEGKTNRIQDSNALNVPTGWVWIVVKANNATGQLELFVNDVSVGTYTLANPASVEYRASYLPGNAFMSGKNTDANAELYVDDVGANDDQLPGPTGLVLSSQGGVYMYQPIEVVPGVDDWDPYPIQAKYENVDDDNAVCITLPEDYLTTSTVGARQAFTIPSAAGSSPNILSMRIVALGSGSMDWIARTGGTFIQSSPVVNGQALARHYPTTPEGNSWSVSAFNSLQFGAHHLSGTSKLNKFYVTVMGSGLSRPAKTLGSCLLPTWDENDWLTWKRFRRWDEQFLHHQRHDMDEAEWMELFPPAPPPTFGGRTRMLLGVGV